MKRVFAIAILLFPAAASAEDVYHFGDDKVEKLVVKIPKPEVAYVLSAPDLTPKYEFELKESFLPRIQESVESHPF